MPVNRDTLLNIGGGMIAGGLVCILAYVTYSLANTIVPADNQNALTLLIGILSANVGTVVNFYFGSSSSTKKQTDTIDTMAKSQAALSPTPAVTLSPGESATVLAEGSGDAKKD